MTETLPNTLAPSADAEAVAAVRAGDADRFGELVERHADRVYAVAWCRLGDRSLAEEAAQEAFILGYRRLSLLGHADRFGAWITAIARRTAINLGIRHTREHSKRKAWAEDPATVPAPEPFEHGDEPGIDLNAALHSLPPVHRECLALFYLERQSVTDAAQTLGISETAFKVRLHRARHALREQLAVHVESNLSTLRAPTRLTRSVMLALPAASAPLGTLGTLAASLAKGLPFGASLLLLKIVCSLPSLFTAHFIGRLEAQNFQKDDTFRRSAHRRLQKRLLIFIALTLVVVQVTSANMSPRIFAGLFGLLSLASLVHGFRRLHVARHPSQIGITIALALLTLPLCAMAWPGTPFWVLSVGQAAFFLVFSWIIPRLPPRMDFSLFARASAGSLASPESESRDPAGPRPPHSAADLLRFARFLGQELLVDDWHWDRASLVLTLPKVTPNPILQFIPPRWLRSSCIQLEPSGRVRATLGTPDALELSKLPRESANSAAPDSADLESRVAAAVARAWAAFASDPEQARAHLGIRPGEAIFQKPHATSAATRVRVWILRIGAIAVLAGTFPFFLGRSNYGPSMESDVPSPQAIRTFLDRAAAHTPQPTIPFRWEYLLDPKTDPCPPADWFSPAERASFLRNVLPASWPEDEAGRADMALLNPQMLALWVGGGLTPEEAPEALRDEEALRRGVRAMDPKVLQLRLRPNDIPVQGQSYRVLVVQDVLARVQWLSRLGILHELDLEPLVQDLRNSQVPGGASLADRWPVPADGSLDGLFVLWIGNPLKDTRDALHLLHLAGRLDAIDREAAIRGILRLHQGKGLFRSNTPVPGLLVQGEAPHTFAAWQSLTWLGALDRVPDLNRWEFRYPTYARLDVVTPGQSTTAWAAIQAALLRQRFVAESQRPLE